MKLHQTISYSLLTAGAVASAKALFERWQWEENNVLVAMMLDWDDVQAVATRALSEKHLDLKTLLREYKASGAIYLSIPELTLQRLLDKGELSTAQGADPAKVYLRAQNESLAEFVTNELQARLPHLQATRSKAKNPLISFKGDLPTVAEMGLGFNPEHFTLAEEVGLAPVPRPIGYSWMQPEMIERTLTQAATLGAKIVAIQGGLVPGHEFNMETTIETLTRLGLKCAYFSESRHQRGDWHLVKHLTKAGLVVPAHEFEPEELLLEDWNTVSERWANLVIEAGIRLCSIRFFRVIHAGDPLESMAYIRALYHALDDAGFAHVQLGAVDLTPFHPQQTSQTLAGVGLGVAGAAGLAADFLPLSDKIKLVGLSAAALGLSTLPFIEQKMAANGHEHHHDHDHHDHDHHDHDHHDHHHHDHEHGHSHGPAPETAYASKGLALAAAVVYPIAALANNDGTPLEALTQSLALGTAGAAALGATTAETDYAMGVEPYRAYHLDWLVPLGLATGNFLLNQRGKTTSPWQWLPLTAVGLAAVRSLAGQKNEDAIAVLDREHRNSHTHHLSAFQRILGDSKMALAPNPLRKWSLLAPLGIVTSNLFRRNEQDDLASVALTAAAAGQVATVAGFRNAQRPLLKTLEGRAKGWAVGTILAGAVWLIAWLLGKRT